MGQAYPDFTQDLLVTPMPGSEQEAWCRECKQDSAQGHECGRDKSCWAEPDCSPVCGDWEDTGQRRDRPRGQVTCVTYAHAATHHTDHTAHRTHNTGTMKHTDHTTKSNIIHTQHTLSVGDTGPHSHPTPSPHNLKASGITHAPHTQSHTPHSPQHPTPGLRPHRALLYPSDSVPQTPRFYSSYPCPMPGGVGMLTL